MVKILHSFMDYGHDVVFFIQKKKKVEKVTKEKTIICKISYEIKTKIWKDNTFGSSRSRISLLYLTQ